jgi:predicted DNA-binding transcriptional regulator AlpA
MRLNLHPGPSNPSTDLLAETSTTEAKLRRPCSVTPLAPLLIDIKGLALLLSRSVPSLHRDAAAGRLPASLRISGSKRWRYSEIVAWVEAGCPSRTEWNARNSKR